MNIPILDRLLQMFGARKETTYADALSAHMFEAIKHHSDAPTFDSVRNLSHRDILEECYTYAHRDRPLQVNGIIEYNLLGDIESYDEATESLRLSDSRYMKSLIEVRNYIFN